MEISKTFVSWWKSQHPVVCFYCGLKISKKKNIKKHEDARMYTNDHIKPRSKGGPNKKWNKVPCCEPCNQSKAALSLEEFKEKRGSLYFESVYNVYIAIQVLDEIL